MKHLTSLLLVTALAGCDNNGPCTETFRSGAGWGTYDTNCPAEPDAGDAGFNEDGE